MLLLQSLHSLILLLSDITRRNLLMAKRGPNNLMQKNRGTRYNHYEDQDLSKIAYNAFFPS